MNLTTPLYISNGKLSRTPDTKESIDQAIELLLHTPVGSVPTDPDYGFALTGLMFENFDEAQGTVYDGGTEEEKPIYHLKLSGSSKNLQTFASELNEAIKTYEPRLRDVSTVMTYIRQNRTIIVAIRGMIAKNKALYEYRTTIKVWN